METFSALLAICAGNSADSKTWVSLLSKIDHWYLRGTHVMHLINLARRPAFRLPQRLFAWRCGYTFYIIVLFLIIHHTRRITHWGRVTHICVSQLSISGSDNGLSPGQRQGMIWTNVGILLIRTLVINFSETKRNWWILILRNPFESAVCKMAGVSASMW